MNDILDTLISHRYRVDARLGSGGLADAFLARDLLTGDRVLLKAVRSVRDVTALRREFTVLRSCRHPRLTQVRDFGWMFGGARAYYVADYIDGERLDSWWPGRSWAEQRTVLTDVLHALGVLHRSGVRHGDVKPQNVLVSDGRATLIDLSCVARLGEATVLEGTEGFVAPELQRGFADARADLYALGIAIQFLGVPESLVGLVQRLTATRSEERPSDVNEVLEALGTDVETGGVHAHAGPWVGREQLVEQVDAMIAAVQSGARAPRTLVLEGAPGAGRSRALQELKWRAQPRIRTIEGRSSLGPSEMLGRALAKPVPKGLEAQERAIAELVARSEPLLFLVDDADMHMSGLAALLPEDGPLMLLGSGIATHRASTALPVGPLSTAAIGRWSRAVGAEHVDAGRLHTLTAGNAARVAERLARASAGEDWRADLPHEVGAETDLELREVVAAARWMSPATVASLRAVEISESAITRAHRLGLIRFDPPEVTALRTTRFSSDLRPLAEQVLKQVSDTQQALLWIELGREREAREAAARWEREPGAWSGVLERLGDLGTAARAAIRATDLHMARRCLERASPSEETTLARAEIALKGSRPDEVIALLRGMQRPEAVDLRCQAMVLRTEYEDARDQAERALAELDLSDQQADRFRETVAVARAYLRQPGAEELLDQVRVSYETRLDPVGASRVAIRAGILAYQRGDWATCVAHYQQSLAIARAHGLDTDLAVAWMNLGTAVQNDGDWGAAMEAYDRALRYATLLNQTGTQVLIRFNLACLALEVGAFDRAETLLQTARETHSGTGLRQLDSHLPRANGELALARGDFLTAEEAFGQAIASVRSQGSALDLAELLLLRAQLAVERRRPDLADEFLGEVDVGNSDDLRIRRLLVMARTAYVREDRVTCGRHAHRALAMANEASRTPLAAQAHTLLAAVYDHHAELAADHRRSARLLWARIGATLPESYRDAFLNHPDRRACKKAPHRSRSTGPDGVWLGRFLEINEQLLSSLDPHEVLERAMDAAIRLTSAERGFILLADEDGIRVAVARNVDEDSLNPSHAGFSRSVAERVLQHGRSVITVDAKVDRRFAGAESVHGKQLTSIACLPIRGREGTRGALYLDNRHALAAFREADRDLLQAFADQVALALRNAELHESLQLRTRALDDARAALENRVLGQAARIRALAVEVAGNQTEDAYRYDFSSIVGRSRRMRAVLDTLEKVIDTDLSVLIRGESGTGKELVAQAIHSNSPRKDQPLVIINCAALPEPLIESELFGHVRGAFTGADKAHTGLLVRARGGTVFLDELGEMPLSMQAKLLRAVQEREVRPVGGSGRVPIDVRFIAATNRDLRSEVAAERFREDLFYRLSVIDIEVPPLRERLEDLMPLSVHFLSQLEGGTLSPAAQALLHAHAWPGNVRELANVLTRAQALCRGGTISPADLSLDLTERLPESRDSYRQDEGEAIKRALVEHRWNVSAVSRALSIPRQTLYRRIKELQLQRPKRETER
ncbi:MAG: sigma 54-interacting transcriptional regulator [Myxococcota bacterium]